MSTPGWMCPPQGGYVHASPLRGDVPGNIITCLINHKQVNVCVHGADPGRNAQYYDDPDLIAGSAFAGDVCMQVSEYVAELAITKKRIKPPTVG